MVLGIVLVILAGFSDAIRDLIMAYDTFKVYGRWWAIEGWKNKHKYKSFLFKTCLVFLTDAWHTFKYVFNIFYVIGICLIFLNSTFDIMYVILLIFTLYSVAFNVFFYTFKYLKNKKIIR